MSLSPSDSGASNAVLGVATVPSKRMRPPTNIFILLGPASTAKVGSAYPSQHVLPGDKVPFGCFGDLYPALVLLSFRFFAYRTMLTISRSLQLLISYNNSTNNNELLLDTPEDSVSSSRQERLLLRFIMSYYGDAQWPAGGQPGWDHQTPPTRSGTPPVIS